MKKYGPQDIRPTTVAIIITFKSFRELCVGLYINNRKKNTDRKVRVSSSMSKWPINKTITALDVSIDLWLTEKPQLGVNSTKKMEAREMKTHDWFIPPSFQTWRKFTLTEPAIEHAPASQTETLFDLKQSKIKNVANSTLRVESSAITDQRYLRPIRLKTFAVIAAEPPYRLTVRINSDLTCDENDGIVHWFREPGSRRSVRDSKAESFNTLSSNSWFVPSRSNASEAIDVPIASGPVRRAIVKDVGESILGTSPTKKIAKIAASIKTASTWFDWTFVCLIFWPLLLRNLNHAATQPKNEDITIAILT